MELEVIKNFIDKESNNLFRVGSVYKTDDEDRASFLQEKGYLSEISKVDQKTEISELPVDLSGSVEAVNNLITVELGKDALESLLKSEQEGKNRKTVIEHINSLLV